MKNIFQVGTTTRGLTHELKVVKHIPSIKLIQLVHVLWQINLSKLKKIKVSRSTTKQCNL